MVAIADRMLISRMNSSLQTGISTLRHSVRSSIIRLGREEQAREFRERLREMHSALDPALRRELRDGHAVEVVLAAVLRRDSNAIDVGANEGTVLDSIIRIAPLGEHLAFEPIPVLHKALVDRFPQVNVRCNALSDVAEETEFVHVVNAPAYSGLRQRKDLPADASDVQRIPVRTERLDDLLQDGYVPTLVKIDVEGAELQVLRGAIETLQRHRPVVLFEHGVGGADLYGAHPNEVFDLLEAAGLRIFDLDGRGPYSRGHFEATFTEPLWNFLATPA